MQSLPRTTRRHRPRSTARIAAWLCCALAATIAIAQGTPAQPASVPASRQADYVAVITVKGAIDRITSMSVQRRLDDAVAAGADAIVLDIDSPGGEIGAVLEISAAIKSSPIPNTVAWIHPQAYSGGAIIALACAEIVTADPGAMGDAFPVTFGTQGLKALTPDQRTKLLPPLLQDVTDSARRNGYDEFLVQVMVTDGIELWAIRDTRTGRTLLINQDEYVALFGVTPARGHPLLGSVPGARTRPLSERADTENAPDPDPANTPSNPETDAPPIDSPAGPEAAPEPVLGESNVDPDAAFTPAGEGVADLTQDVTNLLDTPTNRPDVARLSAQRWEPAGYVTDGTHAVILSAQQMHDFGVASATINNDEELRAFFGAKTLARADRSWSESLVRFMTSIPVRGVLIVIFLLALFMEMSAPGMIAPGAIALAAAVALLAPPMLIGMAGWWEIAAIASGILLIAMEILVIPGFGVFGVAGLLLLFGGLVGTFIPDSNAFPGAPGQGKDLFFGVVTIVLAAATAGLGMYFVGKHFGRLPIVSRLVLKDASPDEMADPAFSAMIPPPAPPVSAGDIGRAVTALRPSGRAEFGDAVIDVVSDMGYIEAGEPVRVVSADEFRILVERDVTEGAEA
ncbi:MAG: NfeD family protein [Phycisphaerales bacterium JB059]